MASRPLLDLCQIPALRHPDGLEPNFDDPESLSTVAIVIACLLTAVSCVVVSGRIYANYPNFSIGDAFVVLSFVFSIGYFVVVFGLQRYFRHQWDVPACWFTAAYLQWNLAQGLLVPLAICFSKAAIFLLLRQVFAVHVKMRTATTIGLVANFLLYTPNLALVPYFQTPRPDEQWEDLFTNGRPQKYTPYGAVQGPLALLLDVYIFALPLPIVYRLNMPWQARAKVLLVFGTAVIGVVASVFALVSRIRLLDTSDGTWSQAQLFISIMVENYVALIVACMPAFARFLSVHAASWRLYRALLSWSTMSRGNADQYTRNQSGWRLGEPNPSDAELCETSTFKQRSNT